MVPRRSCFRSPGPPLKTPELRPVRRPHVYEEVLAQIEPLIQRGRLRQGTRLPPERELARTLGVSRTSLREAIRILTIRGLLDSKPGRGTIVKASSADAVARALASAVSGDEEGVFSIMEFRKAVEPAIAEAAALQATPEEIAAMEEILDREAQRVQRAEPTEREDAEFHNALAAATRNPVFVQVTTRCMDLIQATRKRVLQAQIRSQKSHEAHRRVLRAVQGRDGGAARDAMHAHLVEVEDLIRMISRSKTAT